MADIEEFETVPLEERMQFLNMYDMLKHGTAINPEATAISFILSGEQYQSPTEVAYRELLAKATQTANFLYDLGVGPRDVVSYLLPTLPQTHYVLWGSEAAGIVNPVNPLLEADTIINVPVAKSHSGARISFGMKGWMGVVKNRKPWHMFLDLHQSIADISVFIKPKLTILDATRALVTGGPGGPGEVAQLQTIVAGTDPVAVDAYGVTLAPWGGKGYKIEDIPHIVKAAELGVGRLDISNMNILKKTA